MEFIGVHVYIRLVEGRLRGNDAVVETQERIRRCALRIDNRLGSGESTEETYGEERGHIVWARRLTR